jgi:hypothetical protein
MLSAWSAMGSAFDMPAEFSERLKASLARKLGG